MNILYQSNNVFENKPGYAAIFPKKLSCKQRSNASLLSVIRDFGKTFRSRTIEKGENIYFSSDSDSNLYLIESGQVKISIPTVSGKTHLLAIYTSQDIFGESCLTGTNRHEIATAMQPSVIRCIPYSLLMNKLESCGLMVEFVKYLANRLSEQQLVITDFATANSEYRLAVVLYRLAEKLGMENNGKLAVKDRVSLQELSEMVGTTRSRVGYFMKKFRDLGMLSNNPQYFFVANRNRFSSYLNQMV